MATPVRTTVRPTKKLASTNTSALCIYSKDPPVACGPNGLPQRRWRASDALVWPHATTLSANGQVLVTTSETAIPSAFSNGAGNRGDPEAFSLFLPWTNHAISRSGQEGSAQSATLNDDGSVIAIGLQSSKHRLCLPTQRPDWSLKGNATGTQFGDWPTDIARLIRISQRCR